MDLIEFGKRVFAVREQILKMSQTDLANQLGVTQVLVSRLENGVGGNINIIFDFLNLLKKKKLQAHMIFSEPFNIGSLSTKSKPDKGPKVIDLVNEIKQSASENQDRLILLHSLITQEKK